MRAESTRVGRRFFPWLDRSILIALAAIPMLLSSPGRVSADSREYLYLDPAAFLQRATSLWDPSIAAGTVPHQHLGFLWPMGPWFVLGDLAGLPVWVTQRLWLAAIIAVAGLGAAHLARSADLGRVPALTAAIVYQFTPFQLAFTARFSALLLAWAALPWLVVLARRATRELTWHAPLLFGLVAATAGSVNASSLALVMVAPGAVVLAAWIRAAHRWQIVGAGARLAVATVGASAWWLSGLLVEGRFGLPVLQLTENVDTISAASHADDIVRGLGNWIFTSTDGTATSIEQASGYTDSVAIRLATIALPATGLAALILVRRRERAVLAWVLTVATVVAVGAAPLGEASLYGSWWKRFAESNSLGLALRNTPRIVPVIALVTATAIALGLNRLARPFRIPAGFSVVALVAVTMFPVAQHGFLADDFDRAEHIPDYWTALAADLDASSARGSDPGARVLEIPGSNFAAYDWGNTVEPITPGLIARPYLAREVLPAGGPGTADLLAALDRHFLDGTVEQVDLAPIARLLGIGDVVVRGDIDHARFGLPDPAELVRRFAQQPPPGFDVAGRYGAAADGTPLLLRLTLEDPAALIRADTGPPVLLAGDGGGIVDAAAAGLIDGRRTVLTGATTDDAALADALDRGAELIVTDTNRKQATTFFYTIVDDVGATERAGAVEPDPTGYDVRFGPFAEAAVDEQSVAVHVGGTVTSSMGGGPERPEHRAVLAVDGDVATAWRPRVAPVGQSIDVQYAEPLAADEVTIVAADGPAAVTGVRITVDGAVVDAALDARSRTPAGQRIALPVRQVETLRIEVTAVDGPGEPGLAEVRVGNAVVDEVISLPTGLLDRAGERATGRRLSFVMTRRQGNLVAPGRATVETAIDRNIAVPATAAFEVRVTAGPGEAISEDAGCRSDLLAIDGDPVPLRAVAGSMDLESCAAVTLREGDRRITSARLGDADVDVDRVVLTTGADPVVPTAASVGVVEYQTRRVSAQVSSAGTFWFTLAQSANDGWQIDVDGGRVVTSSMTDGFANGWLIEPDGTGPVRVALRWTPQRLVWIGMAISALTMLAAALVWARRRSAPLPASGLDERLTRRSVPRTAITLGVLWPASWLVVAGVEVMLAASVILVVRLSTQRARVPLAAIAAAAIVMAEMTARPSLVFVGLSCALAEVVSAGISPKPRPRSRPVASRAAGAT